MNGFSIGDVTGREILDSRGTPTIEAVVRLRGGAVGRAAVPSGASTGSREVLELRDKDPRRYLGRGVTIAVGKINSEIRRAIAGKDARDQKQLDGDLIELDGSRDGRKSRLGGNSILAVSLAVAHAAAEQAQVSLYTHIRTNIWKQSPYTGPFQMPVPMLNFINGGKHAHNGLDFQEFMLMPHGARSFEQSLEWASQVYRTWQSKLRTQAGTPTVSSYGVGDEGGFSIRIPSAMGWKESVNFALGILQDIVNDAGHTFGTDGDFAVALDPAASEFYRDGSYILGGRLGKARPERVSAEQLVAFYDDIIRTWPIVSIEDGMAEADDEGWAMLTKRLGSRCQLVGDDLFVTNPHIFAEGIEKKIANAILVKVNQIGTLTEALEVIRMAKANDYGAIISHRSGETEDTTICDIAVATDAGQIKTGCLSRGDRVAKYNRLLRIAAAVGPKAAFDGHGAWRGAIRDRAA